MKLLATAALLVALASPAAAGCAQYAADIDHNITELSQTTPTKRINIYDPQVLHAWVLVLKTFNPAYELDMATAGIVLVEMPERERTIVSEINADGCILWNAAAATSEIRAIMAQVQARLAAN